MAGSYKSVFTPFPESGNYIYGYFTISFKDQIIVAKCINMDIEKKGEEAQFYFPQCISARCKLRLKSRIPTCALIDSIKLLSVKG